MCFLLNVGYSKFASPMFAAEDFLKENNNAISFNGLNVSFLCYLNSSMATTSHFLKSIFLLVNLKFIIHLILLERESLVSLQWSLLVSSGREVTVWSHNKCLEITFSSFSIVLWFSYDSLVKHIAYFPLILLLFWKCSVFNLLWNSILGSSENLLNQSRNFKLRPFLWGYFFFTVFLIGKNNSNLSKLKLYFSFLSTEIA